MRDEGGMLARAGRSCPLVEVRVQAEIMRHVRGANGAVSRSRITGAVGVSRSKVSMEVGRLLEAGVLAEDGLAESEGGRRSSLLGIPRSAGLVAAVDLGATSIDVALTTLGSDLVAHRGEVADVKAGPQIVLGRVREMLADLLEVDTSRRRSPGPRAPRRQQPRPPRDGTHKIRPDLRGFS